MTFLAGGAPTLTPGSAQGDVGVTCPWLPDKEEAVHPVPYPVLY